jgi:hypothetical protein
LLGSGFTVGRSPSSRFPNCPRLQLPTSHSNGSPLNTSVIYIKSELSYYPRSDSQSVSQSGHHLGPVTVFLSSFFFFEIIFRQLRTCYYGTLSLTRGRVCNLQLLQGLADVVFLGSEFRGTRDEILLSQIWNSPNLEGQVPIFISPRKRIAQIYPQAFGYPPLFRLYDQKLKSKLYYGGHSVGQSALVSGNHLGPATNFSHSLFDYFFDSFGFVDVGRPLWREVGSVPFSFCRASAAEPFSDLNPTGLMSIFYCLYFWDSPNLEGVIWLKSKSKSCYDWRSVNLCLGVKPTLELVTRYYFLSESCCVVSVGRPLWLEVGSVSCQSLLAVFSPL